MREHSLKIKRHQRQKQQNYHNKTHSSELQITDFAHSSLFHSKTLRVQNFQFILEAGWDSLDLWKRNLMRRPGLLANGKGGENALNEDTKQRENWMTHVMGYEEPWTDTRHVIWTAIEWHTSWNMNSQGMPQELHHDNCWSYLGNCLNPIRMRTLNGVLTNSEFDNMLQTQDPYLTCVLSWRTLRGLMK